MSELIKAVVSIKDPFALLAFFAVILLIAFRTKTVPESLFGLLREKITRERFYKLLNRSLLFGFAVFLVLCGIAVLGQVLGYMTTARAASVEELKQELALRGGNDTAVQQAIAEYQKGLALVQSEKLSEAIVSLESSLKAVPTAIARETLALLYQKTGNSERATQLAQQSVSAARETGSALNTAKAERLLVAVSSTASNGRPPSQDQPPNELETGKIVMPGNGETYYNVYDSAGEKKLAYALTGQPMELFPGTYIVELNGSRQTVVVGGKRETVVAAGILVVPGTGSTYYNVYDSAGEKKLAYALTGQPMELFPGTYIVELNASKSTVRVVASQNAAPTKP